MSLHAGQQLLSKASQTLAVKASQSDPVPLSVGGGLAVNNEKQEQGRVLRGTNKQKALVDY